MYNSNYPYPYGTPYYLNGYSNPAYQQQNMPQQPNTNKIYVAGIEDVKMKSIPVNSDYIFLDNDKPLIYRKTTDATGKMDIQVFKIIPYEEEPKAPAVDLSNYVLKSDFEELKAKLETLMAKPVEVKQPQVVTTGGTL